jgi:riboflavin kinase/FMN adenylyltransferase
MRSKATFVTGKGIGSKQTVPTLNLRTSAEVLPAVGVYITRTRALGGEGQWNSISNIGYRPTFEGHELSDRDFSVREAGTHASAHPGRVSAAGARRAQVRESEALKAQILRDVARAQGYFRRLDRWVYSR